MAGIRRDDPYQGDHPQPVHRDGNDTSKISANPQNYNGQVQCGHICHMNSRTGLPEDPPEYYEDKD